MTQWRFGLRRINDIMYVDETGLLTFVAGSVTPAPRQQKRYKEQLEEAQKVLRQVTS